MKDTLFVFDIDGTLTDSVGMYLMAVTRSLQSLGIDNIDTDYNNYKHHTDSYALRYNYERSFQKDFSVQLLDDFENDLVAQMLKFDPVKEVGGAKDLIHFFKESNVSFCYATGSLPKPAILKLKQCGIWYDELLLATSKTHESREGFVMDAVERASRFYNRSTFKKIVSIGDGLWDLKTAQNLSLDFVGIGDANKKILKDNGAVDWYTDINGFRQSLV